MAAADVSGSCSASRATRCTCWGGGAKPWLRTRRCPRSRCRSGTPGSSPLSSRLEIDAHRGEVEAVRRLLASYDRLQETGDLQVRAGYAGATAASVLRRTPWRGAGLGRTDARRRITLGFDGQDVKRGSGGRSRPRRAGDRAKRRGVRREHRGAPARTAAAVHGWPCTARPRLSAGPGEAAYADHAAATARFRDLGLRFWLCGQPARARRGADRRRPWRGGRTAVFRGARDLRRTGRPAVARPDRRARRSRLGAGRQLTGASFARPASRVNDRTPGLGVGDGGGRHHLVGPGLGHQLLELRPHRLARCRSPAIAGTPRRTRAPRRSSRGPPRRPASAVLSAAGRCPAGRTPAPSPRPTARPRRRCRRRRRTP